MNTKLSILGVLVGLSLAGCGPKLTLEGARVQVLPSADAAAGCQPVSAVDATASSKENAEIALRNKAGGMNADRVVVSETLEAGGDVKLLGKAFSCSAADVGGPKAAPAE